MSPVRALRDRGPVDQATVAAVVGVVAVGVVVPLVLWLMTVTDYDVWGGLLVAVALLVISTPILLRIGRRLDRRLMQIIAIALVAKLAAAAVRYFVAFEVYGGTADAGVYLQWGRDLAESFRQGIFTLEVGRDQFVGTGFMRFLSGVAITFIGGSGLGAFIFFSWVGFWGLYGFFRAFQIAVPDADDARYAVLLFFLPTMLYWPSSIGKEAWMMLVLGLAAYGAANVLTRRPGGYLPLAVGIAGVVMMRPHIAALFCIAVAAGYLHRTSRRRSPLLGPLPQVLGLALLVVATFFVIERTEAFFDLDESETVATGTEAVLELTQDRTSTGGSTFAASTVRSPADVPRAAVTVLFRPFPWEATNLQMLLSAAEGALLFGLVCLSWRRIWQGVRQVWANPYLRFAAVFTLGFVVAYASVANFGILARQRSQLYPLLLVFLALRPVASHAVRTRSETRSETPPESTRTLTYG